MKRPALKLVGLAFAAPFTGIRSIRGGAVADDCPGLFNSPGQCECHGFTRARRMEGFVNTVPLLVVYTYEKLGFSGHGEADFDIKQRSIGNALFMFATVKLRICPSPELRTAIPHIYKLSIKVATSYPRFCGRLRPNSPEVKSQKNHRSGRVNTRASEAPVQGRLLRRKRCGLEKLLVQQLTVAFVNSYEHLRLSPRAHSCFDLDLDTGPSNFVMAQRGSTFHAPIGVPVPPNFQCIDSKSAQRDYCRTNDRTSAGASDSLAPVYCPQINRT